LALSWWAARLVTGFLPALPVPLLLDLYVDGRVAAFGLGLSFLSGIVFGLVPALRASRAEVAPLIRGDSDGVARRLGVRGVFVAGQVAMALMLDSSACSWQPWESTA
jgi:hypothetical protein